MNEAAKGSSLVRILMVIVPVILILGGVLVVVRYGEDLGLTGKRIPKIVTVTGTVEMRGKLLES